MLSLIPRSSSNPNHSISYPSVHNQNHSPTERPFKAYPRSNFQTSSFYSPSSLTAAMDLRPTTTAAAYQAYHQHPHHHQMPEMASYQHMAPEFSIHSLPFSMASSMPSSVTSHLQHSAATNTAVFAHAPNILASMERSNGSPATASPATPSNTTPSVETGVASSTTPTPNTPSSSSSYSMPPKKRPHSVPDDLKDSQYWEKRKKNNDSAKRSRDQRRQKEEQIAMRVVYLEQENLQLRTEVGILKQEIDKLRCLLYNT